MAAYQQAATSCATAMTVQGGMADAVIAARWPPPTPIITLIGGLHSGMARVTVAACKALFAGLS